MDLKAREKRVARLDLVPLAAADAQRFTEAWERLQRRFVDNPKGAVADADELLRELMLRRGYPMADFERGVPPISRSITPKLSRITVWPRPLLCVKNTATRIPKSYGEQSYITARSSMNCWKQRMRIVTLGQQQDDWRHRHEHRESRQNAQYRRFGIRQGKGPISSEMPKMPQSTTQRLVRSKAEDKMLGASRGSSLRCSRMTWPMVSAPDGMPCKAALSMTRVKRSDAVMRWLHRS